MIYTDSGSIRGLIISPTELFDLEQRAHAKALTPDDAEMVLEMVRNWKPGPHVQALEEKVDDLKGELEEELADGRRLSERVAELEPYEKMKKQQEEHEKEMSDMRSHVARLVSAYKRIPHMFLGSKDRVI